MNFKGLPKDYFTFFEELKENNTREWFNDNKPRFRENVQEPLAEFVEAMGPRLKKVSKHFVADPRVNGGSVFRIYKDVRFSKDKKPYKTHGGVQFRHALGKDAHAPGFYIHLGADEIFYGGGMWGPPALQLLKVREAISANGSNWNKIISNADFKKRFGTVSGDRLIRPPKGFSKEDPMIEEMKRKSFFAMGSAPRASTMKPKFCDDVEASMEDAKPLMKFLCDAIGVPI